MTSACPTGGINVIGGSPPSPDAVEEFTVQMNSLAAEYGRTGGGVINIATKQGSNHLHGTLREFLRNSAMDANNFFSNRAGVPLTSFRRNQYGFSVGGPVLLPHYNGRNRTFYFVDYDRSATTSPSRTTTTVPIDAWKQGDFSGLLNSAGKAITIYDPITTQRTSSGSYTRQAFPGNQIPTSRFDPVAQNVLSYWPSPNTASTNPYTPLNNFYDVKPGPDNLYALIVRLDHSVTSAWRTYVRVNRSNDVVDPIDQYGNAASRTKTMVTDRYNAVWDNTYTLTPTSILGFRLGLTRFQRVSTNWSSGFDSTQLGFPPYLAQHAAEELQFFPGFSVSGIAGLGGSNGALQWVATDYDPTVSITKVLSKHTLKAGMEYRKIFLNFWQSYSGGPNGSFLFDSGWTQQNPAQGSTTAGFGFTSFLLGAVSSKVSYGTNSSGNLWNTPHQALSSNYYGFYLQDDYRVTPRLTLNLGIRYELDIPRTERYNRMSYFDLAAPSPIAGKVPDFPDLRGVMRFVDSSHRRQTPTDTNNIGPRFGFAYQIDSKTVARGGYGLMYAPSSMQAANHNGGFQGFQLSNYMIATVDGVTPYNYLRDPFPNGFLQSTHSPSTDLGFAIDQSWFIDYVNSVIQQWNFNLQRQLPAGLVIEAGYIGEKGNHLEDGEPNLYNQLPASDLSLGNALYDTVPNPFYGVITDPLSTLSKPTVQRRQLLAPYPQYTALNPKWRPMGNSLYHAFTLRAQKRFSSGLGFLVAFTGGKAITDCEPNGTYSEGNTARQNVYDRKSERALSEEDIARRLVLTGSYDLPVGRGRTLFNHTNAVVDAFLGGWQINALMTMQTGEPIPIFQFVNNTGLYNNAQRPNSNGHSANLSGGTKNQRIGEWFDTLAFSIAPAFTFGNAPRVLPDVREPGIRNFDLSLFKKFQIRERLSMQFRAEAFNAFNTTQFGRANANIGSIAAGTINTVGVSPRQLQLALKIIF
ncbi:MAG: TonB-dependent receptor [Acidobacteria bacterium]|nr:TonB-dependent receptor [Acidobacteriota bacterium]